MCADCDALRKRIEEIRADYPSDVFPGDVGKGARMALERVLLLFEMVQKEAKQEPFDPYGYSDSHINPEYWD